MVTQLSDDWKNAPLFPRGEFARLEAEPIWIPLGN